ncbi:MAG TPA: hypothetical protein VND96_15200 [Candidatus Micrarchaeaceae archaeon]|nr:hypothetical protein [Candidatus Micrarchaeaceae archaeon]
MLAILLFPIDVALRRLILRIEDVPAWKAAFHRAPARPIAAEATVTRLKERVAGVRTARAAKKTSDAEEETAKPVETIEELRSRLRR